MHLFDESYKLIQRLTAANSSGVTHLSFSCDDRVLATAGADHTLRFWSVDEAKELNTLVGTIERQMKLVEHESTERERESWRQQIVEFKQSVQKAVLVGLSDKAHGIAWRPALGPPYGIAVAADGDVPVGVWELPSL